ncbi:MAG: right-handed parallel beta-helix repeat-containing protein, partial [Akkermansiaceae bacterium]|nr:right-handed parallel beta-helix repeat-containing protein [Armatimonadota bacterium]
ADWHDLSRVEVLPFHTWEMSRFPIEAVDPAANTVRFAGRTIGDQEFTNLAKGNRYLVENVREALSEPGEWYLDGKTGVLTYLTKPDEDLRKIPVVAPRLESLLEIAGAKNIAFERVQFAHTAYNAPKEGRSTWQAEADIPAALTIRSSQSVRLHKCAILHTGGYGLWIRAGSTKCDVWSSVLADLGAGGIKIGETEAPKTEADWVGLNAVRNCRILGGGRLHPAGIGVWIGQSQVNGIADNEIADFYYTGVSVGWHWGYGTNSARQNMIGGNHIHHIGQGVLSDMGGVYTLGGSDESSISYNHIHDIRSFSYGGWGIYFDEGTTNVSATSNVVYNVSASPFHQHYGKDNRIGFNIFAFGDEAQLIRTRDEEHLSFTANHNVILYSGDTLLGGNWNGDGKRVELSHNIYFRLGGEPVIFPGNRTLAQWQAATGQDKESRVADPGFVNPLKGDFRIKPDSFLNEHGMGDQITAALSPRPLSKISVPRITPAFFPYVPPRLVSIRETFEEQAVGTVPQSPTLQVITEPDTPGAGVTVTEEASSGGKAIRVTDAPGQKASYNPHLFWQPRFDKGTISARFMLRWQPGASLSHEWRTYANGNYQIGPNIAVDAKGTLTANGKTVATLPDNRWVTLTITCGVGEKANGTYDLILSHEDANGMTIEKKLPNRDGKQFDRLDWWGFVADGTGPGTFYLDDISLETK